MTICVFPTSAFTTVSVNVLRCTSWLHFFGGTHIVYSLLRLSRSLYILAARALYLLTTNFYDDYILASRPGSMDLARSSMELVFLLTGRQYATEGKKCMSLDRGVQSFGRRV